MFAFRCQSVTQSLIIQVTQMKYHMPKLVPYVIGFEMMNVPFHFFFFFWAQGKPARAPDAIKS
jgi:hypothetical protein